MCTQAGVLGLHAEYQPHQPGTCHKPQANISSTIDLDKFKLLVLPWTNSIGQSMSTANCDKWWTDMIVTCLVQLLEWYCKNTLYRVAHFCL